MCDCYTAKCETCGCSMAIHIADYCTGRENVHPYCDRCTPKLKKKGIPKGMYVHTDRIGRIGEHGQVEGGKRGAAVVILCDDPEAYGIHLN